MQPQLALALQAPHTSQRAGTYPTKVLAELRELVAYRDK
jgi:hypothetical protein